MTAALLARRGEARSGTIADRPQSSANGNTLSFALRPAGAGECRHHLSLPLTVDENERLERLAGTLGLTRPELIREALDHYVGALSKEMRNGGSRKPRKQGRRQQKSA